MQDVTSTPLPNLPPRQANSHKGDYGRVLIVGGSREMAGAPALAGMAALRSGAGLVTLVVPRSIQSTVASFEPSIMTFGLGDPCDDSLFAESQSEILDAAANKDAVAIGPGLGRGASTARLVGDLYASVRQPMVVDADALNALAKAPAFSQKPGGVRILTPHAGEFERLAKQQAAGETDKRAGQAGALCDRDGSGRTIVVLKGHRTVITDGEQYAVNATGNPGMATGGTGDCLTGIITALVAQGLSPWEAARLGVHVHGMAGDLAAERLGQVSLIASDLIDFLPAAFVKLAQKPNRDREGASE
ncbi:MAG: NAD(P)H-hydrate dehydratase [Planctomycetes bacterium]|nr:NAD(P)H-hydrate dehydratase [Planctomycetota bacterium]